MIYESACQSQSHQPISGYRDRTTVALRLALSRMNISAQPFGPIEAIE